ncbi:MAG TPA: MFS transporter, partial [Bdellovibrionota bacterium]|nr:MFS transporter [Bdellovibrionota bacterium]
MAKSKQALKVLLTRRMLITLLLGFCSGLPLALVASTLQAWMTDAHVDLTVIGIFALVQLPYTLKFVWSPLLDRYVPPFLGRRRGWLLISQIALMGGMASMASTDPSLQTWRMAALAVCVAFFSATQDIVIDAYRTELLPKEELGFGAALYVVGYRLAMLVSGATALFLAMSKPWHQVYLLMAVLMGLGIVITFFAPEPETSHGTPKSLTEAIVQPFLEFFKRSNAGDALVILAFILLFKLGDSMAGT